MLGDNKSVIDSYMQFHSKTHKRHNFLFFHRVCEAIASGMAGFYFVEGKKYPADNLSKSGVCNQV